MPDTQNDHEAIIALHMQVQQHHEKLTQLDDHDRATLVTLTRYGEHIQGLKESHTAIRETLATMQAQQATDKAENSAQFVSLDDKISTGNMALRDHFDEKIDSWRDDLDTKLQREKEALPQWAKVRMMKWSVAIAVLAVAASVLEFLHVL